MVLTKFPCVISLFPEIADFLLSNPNTHIESNGKALLIFTKERLAGVNEIKKIKAFATELKDLL